ncbi:helix-turn-helix domain-containing protein [Pedobacter cryoconitis]|uniref:helix-turn-helix domain-containing protein n=1 Tax=Pedobacter cryoconitis TaxID=188932 RepID=UPI00160CA824|nr:AraC family transcriptional regulator [Pedobacter cryoconitis]MBB5645391.1 AraC-like DNA-binding protein [Pedobacter cryoconitis]
MPIKFHNEESKQFISINEIDVQKMISGDLVETEDMFRLQDAAVHFKNWYFDGYRMAHSWLDNQENTLSYGINNDIDAVRFYFNIKGNTNFHYQEFNKNFNVNRAQYNLLYSPELNTEVVHGKGISEIFSLQLKKERFTALLGESCVGLNKFVRQLMDGKEMIFSSSWLYIGAEIERCVSSMLNCSYINELKSTYLSAKSTELLILLAHATSDKQEITGIKTSADKDKIYGVKEFLDRCYTEEISLDKLCTGFGLNEFKLKKGFKDIFNTSVIDYLISRRLEESYPLLAEKKLNISEVAYKVGYSSPSHFSKSFKKRFGFTPSQIK